MSTVYPKCVSCFHIASLIISKLKICMILLTFSFIDHLCLTCVQSHICSSRCTQVISDCSRYIIKAVCMPLTDVLTQEWKKYDCFMVFHLACECLGVHHLLTAQCLCLMYRMQKNFVQHRCMFVARCTPHSNFF